MTINNYNRNLDANRHPLTGAHGANLVGTGIGAVVGGLAGEGVAEAIDPTRARASWSEDFSGRDSVENGFWMNTPIEFRVAPEPLLLLTPIGRVRVPERSVMRWSRR